ncbi:hypothetical protein MLD38_034561 [Melastoma candidum]|uniref:Uncharacterized protein n=1 Tax=Melastoma candidum TaxID=119954 RepID=A0ACB9MEC9_9MYRT|nr:hypothetical protein MLD38_034561 [Melastoma candidum]
MTVGFRRKEEKAGDDREVVKAMDEEEEEEIKDRVLWVDRTARSGLAVRAPFSRSKGDRLASEIAEPTSPRVTCSGQVRVRRSPRTDAEEFGRICGGGKKQSRKKSTGWQADGQGSKKDRVKQPPACLRRTWLDLRCFGCSFPESRIAGDAKGSEEHQNADAMGTMFAKWFMVLQQDNRNDDTIGVVGGKDIIPVDDVPPGHPPPGNALLVMRCPSSPTRCWSGRTKSSQNDYEGWDDGETEEEEEKEEKDQGDPTKQKINDDGLVTTKYDSGSFSHKAHGTVNRSGPDPLTRSKSWRI